MAKRVVLIIAAVVVVVVVAAIFGLFSKLDSLVAAAIGRAGSHVTGTDVSVGGVDIALKDGRGVVTNLTVANPAGFSTNDAFTLGEIAVDIDVHSVRSARPIVIELLRVGRPEIRFELDANGRSNIDAIRKHAETVSGSSAAKKENAGNEAPPILIRSVQFEEGRIVGDVSAVGLESFDVTLPSFTLSNIGAPNGAQPDEIGKIIVAALARKGAEAVARDKGADALKEELEKNLGDKVKSLFD